MKQYLTKTIDCKALDVDTSNRKVKVAVASMGNLDRDGDIIAPGAFTKTIAERGPNGANEIWHLLDHRASLQTALSKAEEIGIQGDYLYLVSSYRDTFAWREIAWPLYEKGDITQHSIGFSVVNQTRNKEYNEITEVALWEGSAVLWGANPNTPTLDVAKSIGITKESDDLPVRIERMEKALKSDKFEDDIKSLLLIEIRQIKSLYAEQATQPDETTAPVAKGFDWQRILTNIK